LEVKAYAVRNPAAPAFGSLYIHAMTHSAIFETAIGWAGVAWGEQGLVGAHLPERDPAIVRASFTRRFPGVTEGTPPRAVEQTIAGIAALLRGEPANLAVAPLDLSSVPEFHAKVYELARQIPPGQTRTYGEIAVALGDRLLAQQVGAALGKNPWPIVVPCHRVTAANGKLGGFSARGGTDTKLRLLGIEGAAVALTDLFGQPIAAPGHKA
jgi:methylated-DNA-[protein]-cysteine S-methyltransferase